MNQKEIWNKISEKWNKFRIHPAPIVAEFLKNQKGKMLDLGCGSGRNFSKNKGMIYGVDFSKEMLKYAEENAQKKKIKVILKQGETTKIPYKNNYFDSAICIAVLHCIDSVRKRKKTLKELYRVLKLNGEAILSVWSRKNQRLKNKPKECFIPWTVEGKKYDRYTYLFEKEEFENLLEDAGFKVVKIWEDDKGNILARIKK